MDVFTLRSDIPRTHFAPQWNVIFRRFKFEGNLPAIRNWMIGKEEELLNLPVTHDAGTGVSEESLTTRFGRYNVFDYVDECPELNNLMQFLRLSYMDYIRYEEVPLVELDISCWYNILRDGEGMTEHVHSTTSDSYLSGNMQLSEFPTSTKYRAPLDYFGGMHVQNEPGHLVMFPSYIPHSVDGEYTGKRLSLAFDLAAAGLPHMMNSNDPDEPAWPVKRLPFMNAPIYSEMIEADRLKNEANARMPEQVPGIWTGGSIVVNT